jgi:hypothetical protein
VDATVAAQMTEICPDVLIKTGALMAVGVFVVTVPSVVVELIMS